MGTNTVVRTKENIVGGKGVELARKGGRRVARWEGKGGEPEEKGRGRLGGPRLRGSNDRGCWKAGGGGVRRRGGGVLQGGATRSL